MSNKERVADCSVERSNIGFFFAICVTSHCKHSNLLLWKTLLSPAVRWLRCPLKGEPVFIYDLGTRSERLLPFNVVFFVLKCLCFFLFFLARWVICHLGALWRCCWLSHGWVEMNDISFVRRSTQSSHGIRVLSAKCFKRREISTLDS